MPRDVPKKLGTLGTSGIDKDYEYHKDSIGRPLQDCMGIVLREPALPPPEPKKTAGDLQPCLLSCTRNEGDVSLQLHWTRRV